MRKRYGHWLVGLVTLITANTVPISTLRAEPPGGAAASPTRPSAVHASFVSETESLSRFHQRAHDTQAVAEYRPIGDAAFGIIPGVAVVAGIDHAWDSAGDALPGSHEYAGLALRATRGTITLSLEGRLARDAVTAPEEKRVTYNRVLRANRWRRSDLPIKWTPDFLFANESYIDAIWQRDRDRQAVATVYDVIALRRYLTTHAAADLMLQPWFTVDTNKTYEHNRLEMRAGGQIVFVMGPVTTHLTAQAVHTTDLPRGSEPEPKAPSRQWSRRFALSVICLEL